MSILKFPHPILFEKMPIVEVFDDALRFNLDAMYKIMLANNGIGLSANQVGLRHRMFVMKGPEGQINFINPIISFKSKEQASLQEGCLSAPGYFIVVPSRSKTIEVAFQDENGKPKKVVLTGIYSVCAQHEIEHLDGETFMKNKSLSKILRKTLAKQWGLK